MAAEHEKMAKSYGKVQRLSELASHCHRLASYYKSAAKEYKGIAVIEREEAKPAQ